MPPAEGETDADMARRHAEVFLEVARRRGLRRAEPAPDVPEPARPAAPGAVLATGLRERIWWGAGSNATAVWAAKLGMNLQSSTLKDDESGEPFHVQQAEQIELYREAWKEAGHEREPRVSVSRSIFAIVDERDRPTSAATATSATRSATSTRRRARSSGGPMPLSPDELVAQLAEDEAIAAADTLLLTVPNQLGVDYNAHVIESILKHVAPAARLALTAAERPRGLAISR